MRGALPGLAQPSPCELPGGGVRSPLLLRHPTMREGEGRGDVLPVLRLDPPRKAFSRLASPSLTLGRYRKAEQRAGRFQCRSSTQQRSRSG